MRELLFIIVAAACAACAEEVEAPIVELEGMPPPVEQEQIDELSRTENPQYAAEADVCALLPDDGSACAHACDPVALLEFIPAGTCATFECPLANGTIYRTGGCRD